MPPKNKKPDTKKIEMMMSDDEDSRRPQVSFHDLEKSMIPFSGDDTYPIKTWLNDFGDTARLMNWSEVEKIIYAKRLLTGTAKLFLRSLGNVKTWSELRQELLEEFGPKINSAVIHKKLSSRKMKNDETFQQYFLHMKEVAMHGGVEDEALMEYVIDGIRDSETNKAILYGAETLKEFRKKLDLYAEIRKKSSTTSNRTIPSHHQPSTPAPRRPPPARQTRCYNCGETDHQLPACTRGIKCFRCNEYGHKSNDCNKNTNRALKIQENGTEEISVTPYKDLKINDVELKVLIDTGSDVNLINMTKFKRLDEEKINYNPNDTLSISGIAENEVKTQGSFIATVQIDGYYYKTTFYVVDEDTIPVEVILGNPILADFELNFSPNKVTVKKIQHLTLLAESEKEAHEKYDIGEKQYAKQIVKMIEECKPAEVKKESNVELKILLTDESPIYQNPRRLSPFEMDIVNKQLDEWTEQEVIKTSKSDFASPIVLSKKKNGKYRLCIDYRRLNKKVIKERFPLPLIEDQVDKLKGAKLFTTLDLANGFLHVKVNEDSQKYTAFVTPQGQFEFRKMPFGLCTAPSVFQRFINSIFRDLILNGTVLTYLDDLITPSLTADEGMQKIQMIFQRAAEYGLQFNWEKCHFLKREIEYLGYVIKDNEVRPSKDKIQAVAKFKTPQTIKALQSFLGLTGYFRKFIRNYSIIAKPLSDLLKKGNDFNFDLQCESAFEELKRILCTSPVLRIYDPNLETELHTDASAEGYGAVLLQKNPNDGMMHPVYFMSKKTTPAEKKYHSYYLEILAVAEAIKKFRVYLLGIHFKIVTDCSALTMTLQKKDLPPRVARWALLLEEYDYSIEHRPGIKMKHADALSRHPVSLIITETTARLKKAQEEDDKIKTIKKLLEHGPHEDYVLENGILCKENAGARLIVVPKKMQTEIIRKNHERGHFGIVKTEELIQREYYIDNLKDKIKTVINNCIECILISHKRGKKEGFLHPLDKGDTPLSTYHVDHLGPLTSTNKNYKYILTVVDGFTKFTWIYPTKTLSTQEVIDKLRIQQQTFGSPHRIITDRNAAFTSNDFAQYCTEEGISHYTITTGQPRGNGQVERVHQIIIGVLSKMSADDPTKWYRRISNVQRAINNTYQRSINMSPFELLMGVKMKNEDPELLHLIEQEMIERFNETRSEMRAKARQSIQKIQEENRRNYNRKRTAPTEYQQGDLVAIKRTQFVQGAKLHPKYLGPYEVTEKKNNERYGLRKIGTGEGPMNTTSSADMMKPWIGDEDTGSSSSEADEEPGRPCGIN